MNSSQENSYEYFRTACDGDRIRHWHSDGVGFIRYEIGNAVKVAGFSFFKLLFSYFEFANKVCKVDIRILDK